MPRLIDESFTLRRLARRAGWRPKELRPQAPERPLGIKLELTHRCNLRCDFCYTDSPRHTLAPTPDLSDRQWVGIADEAAELAVREVVLSGGEPLLRRELVFELLERLSRRELRLALNTNGWFVDDAVADRLASIEGLRVDISIDGPAAALHDSARGVPGSWGRAVRATSRLLDRGVRVDVVQVITPENERVLADFLEQMHVLGVTSVHLTPVVEIGAAARGGQWKVSRRRLHRAIARFRRDHGNDTRVVLQPGNARILAIRDEVAPATLLVRPSGAVLTDSLHPFAFGHAVEDGLPACWQRVTERWRDPRISTWAGSLRHHRDIPRSGVVPYLGDEVWLDDGEGRGRGSAPKPGLRPWAGDPLPPRGQPSGDHADPEANLTRARAEVRTLALGRRYRLGPAAVDVGPAGGHAGTPSPGTPVRLTHTASLVMDALDGGTVADGVDRLADRFAGTERAALEREALAATRSLRRQGIIVPARAPGPSPSAGVSQAGA